MKPISDITNIFNHFYKDIFFSLRKKNYNDKFAPIDLLISSILTETIVKALKEKDKATLSPNIWNLISEMDKDYTLLLRILDVD